MPKKITASTGLAKAGRPPLPTAEKVHKQTLVLSLDQADWWRRQHPSGKIATAIRDTAKRGIKKRDKKEAKNTPHPIPL